MTLITSVRASSSSVLLVSSALLKQTPARFILLQRRLKIQHSARVRSLASRRTYSSRSGLDGKAYEAPRTSLPITVQNDFPNTNYVHGVSSFFRTVYRVSRIAALSFFDSKALALLGMSTMIVYTVGFYEGTLLVADPFYRPEGLRFCHAYAWNNILSSMIWSTTPPEVVALAKDLDPQELLRSFGDSREDSTVKLKILNARTTRSLFGGFLMLSQLLRFVTVGMRAGSVYSDHVMHGREPLMPGFRERVIRLAGMDSDVTALSLERYGRHIVPIYEDGSQQTHLIKRVSMHGSVPVYWQIPEGHYSSRHCWKGFKLDPAFLIPTKDKSQKLLIVEADGTKTEMAYNLGIQTTDLSLEDASQAFTFLQNKLHKLDPDARIVRIFLGDTLHSSTTGGGIAYTIGERARNRKEVDILVDSAAPVLYEVLRWVQHAFSEMDRLERQNRIERIQQRKLEELKEKEKGRNSHHHGPKGDGELPLKSTHEEADKHLRDGDMNYSGSELQKPQASKQEGSALQSVVAASNRLSQASAEAQGVQICSIFGGERR
eukprot:Clim_evm52s229 gene=Clim_evmTU52s229